MSKGKTRLGLVGLCATAAMALMAFGASGAQAAKGWLVGGAPVTSPLPVTLVITGDTLTRLLTTSVGLSISIDCKTYAGSGTLEASGAGKGEVKFSNCETFIKEGGVEVLHGECKPTEPIVANGTLEATVNGTETEIKATGLGATKKFAEVKFPNEECLLPTTEVKGSAWLKDCQKEFLVDKLIHLLEEDQTKKELKYGLEPASIDGSVNVEVVDGGVLKTFAAHGS